MKAQAHDKNGKALNWDAEKGKFDGDVAFKTDKNGKTVYAEATITVYETTIGMAKSEDEKNSEMVAVVSHEGEHDLNTDDINSIKDRQEGRENQRDPEAAATNVENKVRAEINKKKKKEKN